MVADSLSQGYYISVPIIPHSGKNFSAGVERSQTLYRKFCRVADDLSDLASKMGAYCLDTTYVAISQAKTGSHTHKQGWFFFERWLRSTTVKVSS